MSLKAKLEAVIYAAEEPVTLAQLAALFAADALEWKAQQQAAYGERADTQPFLVEQFAYSDADPDADPAEDRAASPPAVPGSPAETVSNSDTSMHPESEPDQATPVQGQAEAVSAASAEAGLEARRQARLRDREARAVIRLILDELIDECISDDRGVEIREIAGGFRVATKPQCHDAVRLFVRSLKPALRLSLPALETLAVIAYKQPVTAPEVNEIRGVDSSAVFGSLLARKLIATAGRKPVIGRPILYKTTREFLLRFGLKDVTELPSMEEFEKMAAMELDEPEPATGDDPNLGSNPALGPEFDEAASEELEDSPAEGLEPATESETAETAVSIEP
ncbi:MAG: SMC-Scp complex subunit ScpB [Terracidiphilus sp.]